MKAFLSIAARCPDDVLPLVRSLAGGLAVGDCITLDAPMGAGKTELARALIRHLLEDPEAEVPSPTFTLVQYYDTPCPLAHADLYRMEDPGEWEELGLDEQLDTGALIVEWPSRASAFLPRHRLDIIGEIAPDGTRLWTLHGDETWAARLLPGEAD